MELTRQTERKIGAILEKHRETLLQKSNVVGVGIGEEPGKSYSGLCKAKGL